MSEKTELLGRMAELRAELDNIEERERRAKNQSLVGTCYRYRNSYSCPESDADRWWLYMRIIGVNEDGWLVVVRFQMDKNGRAEIEQTTKLSLLDGYKPIQFAEWQREMNAFIAYVENLSSEPLGVG